MMQTETHNIDKQLKLTEIAEILGVAVSTLHRWIAEDKFPQPTKFGRASRWPQSRVQKWVEERESQSVDQASDAEAHAGNLAL